MKQNIETVEYKIIQLKGRFLGKVTRETTSFLESSLTYYSKLRYITSYLITI